MRLKEIRTEKGKSREDLARDVGVSIFTVRNWEQGQREPRIHQLIALADALGCSVDDLVRERNGGDETS